MNPKQYKILLIDVSSLAYRAFFALPFMATKNGQATNALYGFVNMYNSALKEITPDVIVACFDSKEETTRKKEYEEYKAQRREMPQDFYSQFPLIEEFLEASGAMCVASPGDEADDIIASFCQNANGEDEYYILSSDKDLMQLVDDTKKICFCSYKSAKVDVFFEKDVFEKFGVYPNQMVDYLSLLGDASDNIEGVKGIGKKTAQRLLQEFHSIEGIYEHIDSIKPPRIKDALLASKDLLERNRSLIGLRRDIQVPDKYECSVPDISKMREFFEKVEFKALLKKIGAPSGGGKEIKELKDASELKESRVALVRDKDSYLVSEGKSLYKARYKVIEEILYNADYEKLIADEGQWLSGFDVERFAGEIVPVLVLEHMSTGKLESFSPEELALRAFSSYKNACDEINEKAIDFFNRVERPLFLCLPRLHKTGVKVDRERLEKLLSSLEEEEAHISQEIYEESGGEFNINSPKQMADILFNKMNLPVIKKGRSHPSTSEEVLRKLAPMSKLVELILEYRQVNKLITAYIKPLLSSIGKDGTIHCRFSQIKTQTGRLTAVEPNLQTIPIRSKWGKEIRKAFISRFPDGYILSADYSQIELRVLAHLSKDEALIEAFNKGLDVHRQTAASILDKEFDDVAEEERDLSKRVNFGIVYGMSAYGLSEETGLPVDMAREFIEKYFQRFSGVKDFIDRTVRKAKIDGYVETLFGRRRFLPELSSKAHSVVEFGKRAAVNTVIQGTAAEIIKIAMVNLWKFMDESSLMVLQIHDELLLDVKPENLNKMAGIVRSEMEGAVRLDVPLVVDVCAGKNWLEVEPV